MSVRRIFVEKRQGFFDIPAQQLHDDLVESFRLSGLKAVRLFNRYDIEGLSDEEYAQVKAVVFSEPPVDVVYEEELPTFPNSTSVRTVGNSEGASKNCYSQSCSSGRGCFCCRCGENQELLY